MKFPRIVYAIQHNITKKIYIGSSSDVPVRYWNHIYRLRNGRHGIEDMQKDFDEYGEDYSLFILDKIANFQEREKEYQWMRIYGSNIKEKGYNYKDKATSKIKKKLPLVSGLPENTQFKMLHYQENEEGKRFESE